MRREKHKKGGTAHAPDQVNQHPSPKHCFTTHDNDRENIMPRLVLQQWKTNAFET
ncbi:MAG: hypothetical protein HFI76_06025 [Lachnospiraceae bacterium]|nr:hypothetical protein [Lachnospiraceae bacterium]